MDPADGEAYLYGHAFLAAAPADVRLLRPAGPQGALHGLGDRATRTGPSSATARRRIPDRERWTLATTPPLATYFVTVCAGPYVTRRTEHDGIPLALHARRSLEGPLDRWADQIFTLTRQGLDRYHGLFGIRYPFGEYHQVFVPEFNAGAMENPGCVTIRDDRLFRGSATDDALLVRARTIEHELAHMWFGDLVTMRWWDDLWLNESFAEYMATTTLVHATEFHEAWTSFGIVRKTWGYAAERRPSTHPVAGSPALDAAVGAAGLRRHLLRQGRLGDPPARRLPRVRTRRVPASPPTCANTPTGTARSTTSSAPWSGRGSRSLGAWCKPGCGPPTATGCASRRRWRTGVIRVGAAASRGPATASGRPGPRRRRRGMDRRGGGAAHGGAHRAAT